MDLCENLRFTTGQKFTFLLSSCTKDILLAINFMKGSGKVIRDTSHFKIVNGVMLITTLLVIQVVSSQILLTSTADSAIPFAILVGATLSTIASLARTMEHLQVFTNEELCALKNVEME